MSAPSFEDPTLRYARLLDLKFAEVQRLQAQIKRLDEDDEAVECEYAVTRVDGRLGDLERKLQLSLKELADLVSDQTVPPGLGDEATEELAPSSDQATEGLFRLVHAARVEILKKLRPDIASRSPEMTPEEIAEGYEDAIGEKPKDPRKKK